MTDEPTSEAEGMKGLYRERAHLLALLTTLMRDSEPHIGENDPETPGWKVLTFETGRGQMSWHIAPEDLDLFRHVRPTGDRDAPWDGHSTDEKYDRLRRLISALAPTPTED